jgi:hypothetical protein
MMDQVLFVAYSSDQLVQDIHMIKCPTERDEKMVVRGRSEVQSPLKVMVEGSWHFSVIRRYYYRTKYDK